ncbi:hypothetical protein V8B97DRAFT_1866834 [Scleroderma yunnanense]
MLDDSHASLAAAASSSAPLLRHRSSTLKPPARLNIPPPNGQPLTTNGHATTTARQPTGIRAHFAHLLPRHAVFLLRISIHELNNVPLVRGEFGVRWKVKGVTNGGLLGKVRGRAKGKGKAQSTPTPSTPSVAQDAHGSLKGKAKARESDVDNASLLDASASISDTHSIAASSSNHSHSHDQGSPVSLARPRTGSRGHAQPRNIPTLVISSNSPAPSPVITRNVSGSSIISSIASSASHSAHPNLHPPAHYLSAQWHPQLQPYSSTLSLATHSAPKSHVISLADTPPTDGYTPANGQTPFVVLRDHNVVWDQTLDFAVQMGVARESGELGECPAKLIVMQRVIPGDPDAPRNPRVGSVYLNLAQYVGAGIVTRQYLLRQSKTNATLKLTIQLEHTGGALSYVAPPLPRGEILSGIAGLLDSETYRNYPSALGLYSSSSGSSDSLSYASSDSSPSAPHHPQSQGPAGETRVRPRQRRTKNQKRKPFDPTKLPDLRGPRATEKLIEAIFNPAPVTSPTRVTPFTYLIEGYDEHDGAYEGGDQASLEREHKRDGKSALGDDGLSYGNTSWEEQEDMWGLDHDTKHPGSESDYQSVQSGPLLIESSEHPLKSKRSIGSRLGLRTDMKNGEAAGVDVGGEAATIEKRVWWQKVLRPI